MKKRSGIKVVLPSPLQVLANSPEEIVLDVPAPVTLSALIDALEVRYPALRGTLRDQTTKQRRPMVRFFACEKDLSHSPLDNTLPNEVSEGKQALFIVGAIAGG